MIRDTSAQDVVLTTTPKYKKRLLIASVIAVVFVSLIGLVWSLPEADISVARKAVQIATVEQGTLVRDIAASGRIVAANAPQMYSPEQGYVELLLKAGDQVKQGQVVARVDSPELFNRLQQQQSELTRLQGDLARQELDSRRQNLELNKQLDLARVDLEAAEREHRRAEISIEKQLISQIDFEEAVDDLARAKLRYQHAQQEVSISKDTLTFELQSSQSRVATQQFVVDELQRKIANLDILATVDGVVGNLLVQQHAIVEKNQALMTLVDLSAYEVELKVAENYANQLGLGMDVELTLGSRTMHGQLAAISPEITEREVTTRVRFSSDDLQGLRQNQQVSARILLENKANVLKVKRGGFLQAGGFVAFRLNGDVAERTDIVTGVTSMREIEVLSGLQAGDQIIISSYDTFKQAPTVLLR